MNIKLVDKEDVEKVDGEITLVNKEDVLTTPWHYTQKLEMSIKINEEGKIIIEEILGWYH